MHTKVHTLKLANRAHDFYKRAPAKHNAHSNRENTSSAYTRAVLNLKCRRSFVYTHADTRAILNTCRVM